MAKILLAEDDEDLHEIFEYHFGSCPHQLFSAKHAEEAVAMAKSLSPDLIFMDIKMPLSAGGDESLNGGLEAIRQIKETPEVAHIPIVALTGHVKSRACTAAMEAGCVETLVKPLSTFELVFSSISRHVKTP